MRTDLRFGAVIPTYNRAHLIGRALESVLRQSRQPAEIIVVDDGSTDDTAERVASFGPVVHYLHQENVGAAAARNRGVRAAQSEWIAFLDSDDIWRPSHLERMARAIEATDSAACFYFSDVELSAPEGGGRLWDVCDFQIDGDYELILDAAEWVMKDWPPMLLQSSVFKRTSFLDSGGFWERLSSREDSHLFMKLGTGRAACAVAGCGVQLTNDDPEGRLTVAHRSQNVSGYWMQVLVHQDILDSVAGLRPADRRRLKRRLATSYRRLARLAWDGRQPFASVRYSARAAYLAPWPFVKHAVDVTFHSRKMAGSNAEQEV